MTLRNKIINTISTDDLQRSGDVWTARRTFYYRHGGTAEGYAAKVSNALTAAGIVHTVVASGEVQKPFRGGASVRASSHWWVQFRLA